MWASVHAERWLAETCEGEETPAGYKSVTTREETIVCLCQYGLTSALNVLILYGESLDFLSVTLRSGDAALKMLPITHAVFIILKIGIPFSMLFITANKSY